MQGREAAFIAAFRLEGQGMLEEFLAGLVSLGGHFDHQGSAVIQAFCSIVFALLAGVAVHEIELGDLFAGYVVYGVGAGDIRHKEIDLCSTGQCILGQQRDRNGLEIQCGETAFITALGREGQCDLETFLVGAGNFDAGAICQTFFAGIVFTDFTGGVVSEQKRGHGFTGNIVDRIHTGFFCGLCHGNRA